MEQFLPSEVGRLVLGYLKEENCDKAYKAFLHECVHLQEYAALLRRGREYPTTIAGKTLKQMLEEYGQRVFQEMQLHSDSLDRLWLKLDLVISQIRKRCLSSEDRAMRSALCKVGQMRPMRLYPRNQLNSTIGGRSRQTLTTKPVASTSAEPADSTELASSTPADDVDEDYGNGTAPLSPPCVTLSPHAIGAQGRNIITNKGVELSEPIASTTQHDTAFSKHGRDTDSGAKESPGRHQTKRKTQTDVTTITLDEDPGRISDHHDELNTSLHDQDSVTDDFQDCSKEEHATPKKSYNNPSERLIGKSPRRKCPVPKRRSGNLEELLSVPGPSTSADSSNSNRQETYSMPLLDDLINATSFADKVAQTINRAKKVVEPAPISESNSKAASTVAGRQDLQTPEPRPCSPLDEQASTSQALESEITGGLEEDSQSGDSGVPVPDNIMTAEAMKGILEMTRTDPAFDALFHMFKVDKETFIDKEYPKAQAVDTLTGSTLTESVAAAESISQMPADNAPSAAENSSSSVIPVMKVITLDGGSVQPGMQTAEVLYPASDNRPQYIETVQVKSIQLAVNTPQAPPLADVQASNNKKDQGRKRKQAESDSSELDESDSCEVSEPSGQSIEEPSSDDKTPTKKGKRSCQKPKVARGKTKSQTPDDHIFKVPKTPVPGENAAKVRVPRQSRRPGQAATQNTESPKKRGGSRRVKTRSMTVPSNKHTDSDSTDSGSECNGLSRSDCSSASPSPPPVTTATSTVLAPADGSPFTIIDLGYVKPPASISVVTQPSGFLPSVTTQDLTNHLNSIQHLPTYQNAALDTQVVCSGGSLTGQMSTHAADTVAAQCSQPNTATTQTAPSGSGDHCNTDSLNLTTTDKPPEDSRQSATVVSTDNTTSQSGDGAASVSTHPVVISEQPHSSIGDTVIDSNQSVQQVGDLASRTTELNWKPDVQQAVDQPKQGDLATCSNRPPLTDTVSADAGDLHGQTSPSHSQSQILTHNHVSVSSNCTETSRSPALCGQTESHIQAEKVPCQHGQSAGNPSIMTSPAYTKNNRERATSEQGCPQSSTASPFYSNPYTPSLGAHEVVGSGSPMTARQHSSMSPYSSMRASMEKAPTETPHTGKHRRSGSARTSLTWPELKDKLTSARTRPMFSPKDPSAGCPDRTKSQAKENQTHGEVETMPLECTTPLAAKEAEAAATMLAMATTPVKDDPALPLAGPLRDDENVDSRNISKRQVSHVDKNRVERAVSTGEVLRTPVKQQPPQSSIVSPERSPLLKKLIQLSSPVTPNSSRDTHNMNDTQKSPHKRKKTQTEKEHKKRTRLDALDVEKLLSKVHNTS